MGKKMKRQPKSFLQKEHEEDEEREAELIKQEQSNQMLSNNQEENENIITNYEQKREDNSDNEEEESDNSLEVPTINLIEDISEKINSLLISSSGFKFFGIDDWDIFTGNSNQSIFLFLAS